MKHRLVLALGALATVAGLGLSTLGPQPSAEAAPNSAGYRANSPEYGMSVFVFNNLATTERDLGKLRALNFQWQKSLFRWRDIEGACKGCYNWAEADRVVQTANSYGLKSIARLDFQPQWARADRAHNGPPDNYQDFTDFVYAFVDRYKTDSPLGTIQAIQVWNEVNLDREWGGGPITRKTATDYVRLIAGAYKAAKLADPNVTVVTGALSPTGVSAWFAQPDDVYLNWLFEDGLKDHYDVLGVNANVQCPCVSPEPASVPGFEHASFYFRRTEQLRAIQERWGDANKQIWLMEFGWTTDLVNPGYAWYRTTEERKAELIVEAFKFARSNWAPWIGVMTLWTVADPNWAPADEQVWWSVTNPDGSSRPAYERLLQARNNRELP